MSSLKRGTQLGDLLPVFLGPTPRRPERQKARRCHDRAVMSVRPVTDTPGSEALRPGRSAGLVAGGPAVLGDEIGQGVAGLVGGGRGGWWGRWVVGWSLVLRRRCGRRRGYGRAAR